MRCVGRRARCAFAPPPLPTLRFCVLRNGAKRRLECATRSINTRVIRGTRWEIGCEMIRKPRTDENSALTGPQPKAQLQRPVQLLDAFSPILEMLEIARYNPDLLQQATPSTRTYYHNHHNYQPNFPNLRARARYTCRNNSLSSFERRWNATKALLVAEWLKVLHRRHNRRYKRSMVKPLTPEKRSTHHKRPSSEDPDRNSSSAKQKPWLGEPCPQEPNGCPGRSSLASSRNRLDEQTRQTDNKIVESMEYNKKASVSRRSSHRHRSSSKGETKHPPEQFIALKKKEAVQRVMAVFQKWLDKQLAIITYAYEASEASEASGGGSSSKRSGMNTGSNSGNGGGPSRRSKRQFNGSDQDESSAGGDGKGGGRDNRGNKRAKPNEEEEKWACPFYKHNPKAHHKWICAGKGWTTISRLKEHLYRCHSAPKHACPRPCEMQELKEVECIGEDALAKLKSRKRQSTGASEEHRWKGIYMILFPDADEKTVPSPYYQRNEVLLKSHEEVKKTMDRIKTELPRQVQRKVEERFENLERDVLQGFEEIIREVTFNFFQGLPKALRSSPATPTTTPRATTPCLKDGKESGVDQLTETNHHSFDLLNYFDNTDYCNFGIDGDLIFGGQADFVGFEKASDLDSGYAS
ncbi:hypothetical protein F4780DRAFT_415498 [Xylariomycetidae sp. FL0641]|nr:hypothetical protein F4780DRAFT_415498 [Xylariomycetidae sp. FL0641]